MQQYFHTSVLLILALGASTGCTIDADADDLTTSGSGGSGGGSGGGGNAASGGATTGGTGGVSATSGGAGGRDGSSSGGSPGSGGSGGDTVGGAAGDDAGGSDSGGSSTGGGSSGGDHCDAAVEVNANEEQDTATPYALDTNFPGCLLVGEDVDFYSFTAPDAPGYMTITVSDVGLEGDIFAQLFSAADTGEIQNVHDATNGASVSMFFVPKPGASFFVSVRPRSTRLAGPTQYVFRTSFHPVNDPHEPNNLRSEATPIEVAQVLSAHVFAGWEGSQEIPREAWHDWYRVELQPGTTSILVEVQAADHDAEITLTNSVGTELAQIRDSTDGSSLVLEHAIPEAGTYFVRVNPAGTPDTRHRGSSIPQYLTVPYKLSITQ